MAASQLFDRSPHPLAIPTIYHFLAGITSRVVEVPSRVCPSFFHVFSDHRAPGGKIIFYLA
jgi:hypothetical protein